MQKVCPINFCPFLWFQVDGLLFVAGQISLDPGSMKIGPRNGAEKQARLALRHVDSVRNAPEHLVGFHRHARRRPGDLPRRGDRRRPGHVVDDQCPAGVNASVTNKLSQKSSFSIAILLI